MALYLKKKVVQPGDFSDQQRWWSIRVMYLTMFLSSVTFTLTLSSIWPFLQVLDPSATADFLGWVVAAYSVGQLVASPFFGMWANYRGQSREPLVASIALGIGANIMYAYLQSIPGNKGLLMIIARGLIGFGAGNVAVVRAYVAGATNVSERTPAMANVSIFQSVGFILGPVIQAALVPISYPGAVEAPGFHLNMYTAPAILGAICCTVNVVLLFAVFREFKVHDDVTITNIQSSYEESVKNYKPDYFAVIYCIIIFFVVLFIFTIFETIATPLGMNMFAWSKKQSTLYVGVILASCGVEAIGVFVVLKILSRRINERYLLIMGFVLCFFGYFVQLPWGDGLPVRAPAVMMTSHTIKPTGVGNRTLEGIMSQLSNHADSGILTMLVDNVTTALSAVNTTIAPLTMRTMGDASSLVTEASIGTAATLTSNIADAVISTAETTTKATTTITDAILSTAETFTTTKATTTITDAILSTAETFTTTKATTTITDAILSTAETFTTTEATTTITDAILSTAETFTTTEATTTITDAILSTAETFTTTEATTTITDAILSTAATAATATTSTPTHTTGHIVSTYSTTVSNMTSTPHSNISTTVEPVGCPATMDWCNHTPPVYLAQYIVGCIIISAGYPAANVMCYTLFSKILGPKPQGTWMGWLTASGSLARTLGPIFVSQIYYSFGPRVTFGADCGIILLTIIAIIAVFKRLVPCKYTTDYQQQNGDAVN
ncbi:major facilitator superfamily domain-containing protein 8-like isoform X2 [Haliotis rufescens]|uniref:major facilitator superfamily domain-containing protein 8-like isoform X2 n=1 Tax=Haliotis rufescens TaxID=6454 RepID=UPI00201E9C60|nr:major facilitator superfamily domain-containing protein 8-like isoform X2 [Haliotis rufescens]